MDANFEQTIDSLNKETPIRPKNVVVAVCTPITENKYIQDRKSNIFGGVFNRKKEFAKLQFYQDWPSYEQNIAIHVLKSLYNIKQQYGANVFFDVKLKQFEQLLNDPSIELVFLIAHHIQTGNKSEIEFGDGGYATKRLMDKINNLDRTTRPALIFIVCQSERFRDEILKTALSKGAIGTATWNMPFVGGSHFVETWISFFDGQRNLSEAYELAIQHYWDSIK